mgnify:CR=1 FL=1
MKLTKFEIEHGSGFDFCRDLTVNCEFSFNPFELKDVEEIYQSATKGSLSLNTKGNAKGVLEKAKVIFQDKNTVLRVGNEVYVAKPEKGEKFDKEKGLLVCLIKALGVTTSDFLELMQSGIDKNSRKKPTAVKNDKGRK